MAIYSDDVMEAMLIIQGTGWQTIDTPFKHTVVDSVYFDLPGGNPDLSPVTRSTRWSCIDVSKYHNPDKPEQYSLAAIVVDEMLGSVFGLTMTPHWAIIVPRDYPATKKYNVRSIAQFFVNIVKKKIDSGAEIYLYSEYQAAESEDKKQ